MKVLIEILLNKWFLSMIVGWIVFFLLIDWKKFNVNIWVGMTACILQLIHDTEQEFMNNYQSVNNGIQILKSSFFFTFGVVFTAGVIFFQFLPRNKVLKIIHVLVFSLGFLFFEYVTVRNGMLKYIHYNYMISFADDVLVFATMAWTKSFVLYIYRYMERKYKRC